MNIYDVLKLECCIEDFSAGSKDEAISKMAVLMKRTDVLKNHSKEDIYEALKLREEKGSTGFTNGIAIPHCQMDNLDKFAVGIAVSKKGISFDSIDKKKSKIFVIIIGPKNQPDNHIKILAQVSRVLDKSDIREILIKSASKINIYESFLQRADADMPDISISKTSREKLVFLVVREDERLDKITEIFLEYGIFGATVIDSQNMENILSNVPLFLEFFDFSGEKRAYNKIIIARINENKLPAIIKSLEDDVGDLDKYSGIVVMAIDLAFSKGNI